MQQIETSLIHRVVEPRAGGSGPHPTLILLHGRGSDENDLLGLASHLDERLLIISARAPYPFQESYGGYTWYEMIEIGIPQAQTFKNSLDLLKRFLGEVISAYSADPSCLYLMGFSMGAVMSYAIALNEPDLVSGIIAHSGYIADVEGVDFNSDKLEGLDFFIAHGTHDGVIPVDFSQGARDFLEGTQAKVVYREYPMDHQISEESLRDVVAWLRDKLDRD